jgi:hypothetical protein
LKFVGADLSRMVRYGPCGSQAFAERLRLSGLAPKSEVGMGAPHNGRSVETICTAVARFSELDNDHNSASNERG